MKKVLLISFLVFCATTVLFAHSYTTIRNIGIKEGLSNGFVDDMVIDGQGFIWTATEWGLNRIAGNTCTVFTTSNSNISNNEQVGLFYHAKSNSIWIYSKDGRVDVYDCKTQRIRPLKIGNNDKLSVVDIKLAADSTLWLAKYNGGIYNYDPTTEKYSYISEKKLPKFNKGIRSITDDGKGNLYIGLRMEGMIIYNIHTGKSKFYCNKNDDSSSLPGNNVRCIFIDHLQNIWVGTNKGLAIYNPSKGTFRTFKHQNNSTTSLAGDNIHQIIETQDHTLWVASDIGGISKLNLNKYTEPECEFASFEQLTKENFGLSSNNTRRIIEDHYGNIWVANYSSGVDFISNNASMFKTLSYLGMPILNVTTLYIDPIRSNLWIGQDNNIILYKDMQIQHSWNFAQHISNAISSVCIFRTDSKGNVWLGTTDNGLLMLNPNTGAFSRIECTKDLDVNALYIDKNDKVWVGTEDGIYTIYH